MTGRNKTGRQYPNAWVSGPDPLRHQQYLVWLQQRNQAQFRKEPWNLAFDDWLVLWGDLWSKRGRGRDDYCMTRQDPEAAWCKHNAVVITRRQHFLDHRDKQVESNRRRRAQWQAQD